MSVALKLIGRVYDFNSNNYEYRDKRLPAHMKKHNAIYKVYNIEWIGREGIACETHEEYLNDFINHFYKNVLKLVDRAMRKEDTSPQGKIITGQLILLCCDERKQHNTKNLMKCKVPASSCEFLQVSASSCNFLQDPASFCKFLQLPATSCNYLQLPAISCMVEKSFSFHYFFFFF